MIGIRRPSDEADYQWLVELQTDPDFYRWETAEAAAEEEIREEVAAKRRLCEREQGRLLFADIRGSLVGYGAIFKSSETAHIEFAVRPDSRRCGFGKALVFQLIGHAKDWQIDMIVGLCLPNNHASAALLRSSGFRYAGQRIARGHYYSMYQLPLR